MPATVDGVRIVGRAWVRFTGLWVLVMLAGATFTSFVGTFADDVLRSQADTLFDNGALTPGGTLIIFLELGLPVLLVVLLLMSLGAGAGTRMADDLLGERGARVWASLRRGLPRTVTILLTALAHGLTVLVAVLATPLLVPVGIVGLVVVPLLRRLFRSVAWPDPRFLLVMAIPFAGAVIVAVRWAVAIPTAALEGLSVRAALRRSWDLTRGHEPAAGLALLGGIGLQVVLLVVVDLVRDSSLPELPQSVVALVGPMLALSIPIAVLTVLFRRLAPDADAPADGDGPPRSSTPGWLARFSRPPATAVLVVVTGLLAGTLAVMPTPAEAVVADITVNDLGDAADVTNTDACTNGTAGCTLRAALAVATAGQTIGFSVSGMIRPASPLQIDTAVTVDGDGFRVELNGDGCLSDGCSPPDHVAVASATGYTLRNLTFTTADWAAAGAALLSSADGQLDQVTFVDAYSGAVEVTGGHLMVTNATFHANGYDLLVGPAGTADVAFSTFHESTGTAIASAGGLTTVSASIVAPYQTGSPPAACTGTTAGALPNVDTDGTCGGTPVGTLGSFGYRGGSVDTVAIDPASNALDLVAAVDCPATDARGVERSEATCDLGAYEYLGLTAFDFVVDSTGDAGDLDPGDFECRTVAVPNPPECTLRAAVEQANAQSSLPTSITFAGNTDVILGTPLVPTRDLAISGGGHVVSVSGADATTILDVAAGVGVAVASVHLTSGHASGPAGGGAIRSDGDLVLDDVSISNSAADSGVGHAIAVDGGTLTILNGTLDGNGVAAGHAISAAAGASVGITHTTIRSTDGALEAAPTATVDLVSSVVSSGGTACTGTVGGGDNQVTDASCPGSVSTDVGLGAFGDHTGPVPTIALEVDSPAVDTAPQPTCPTHDARGVERPQLAACDAGSFEIEPVITGPETFVVNDFGDAGDADTSDGVCDIAPPNTVCTLRAAIEQANARTAASPVDAPTYDVTFDGPGTVTLTAPLELAAAMTIDGGVEGVTLDGGDAHEVFNALPTGRHWELRNLTVANGRSSRGGAGVRSLAPGTITNVTFEGNVTLAGGADGGGAIAALGASLDVVNATFSGNGDAALGGSDIRATVPVTVTNSTFVDSANRRIFGTVDVANSLILWTRDGACGSGVTGHHNIQPDASCGDGPGIIVDASPSVGTFGDHGGPVDTLGLLPDSEAIDAADSATCPGTDARGHAREAACDIGASEYVKQGSLEVSLPAESAAGVSVDVDVAHVPTYDEGFGSGTIDVTSDLDGPVATDESLTDGAATITLTGLTPGAHALTVTYTDDSGFFPGTSTTASHTVRAPAVQDLAIDPVAAVYGQAVTLSSTISDPAASGDVTFTSSLGRVETAPLVAGVATLVLDDLAVGTHDFVASHTGDPEVPDTASTPATVTVSAAPTTLVLSGPTTSESGEPIVLTADITADAPSTATPMGQVTFYDGATPLADAITLVAGQAELSTSLLPVGARTLRAEFTPTSSFITSDDSLLHSVSVADTTTTLTGPATPTALGELAAFEVEVTRTNTPGRTPTGTVVAYVDDVELERTTLDGLGQARFETSDLTEGAHTIRVDYLGEDGFGASQDSVNHSVVLRPTTTALSGGSGGILRTGQSATFTVHVADDGAGSTPTGDVELRFGGVLLDTGTLTAGTVTFEVEVPPLSGASAWVVADYLGDATHGASGDSLSQQIAPAEVSVLLTADPDSAVPGDVVDLTVELTAVAPGAGAPTGAVVVRNTTTGAVIGQGVITGSRAFTFTAGFRDLPIGRNDLTATYTPDAGWANVDPPATASVFVDRAVPTITTTISPAAPERGTQANVSASVDGIYGPAPSGTVTFYVDTVQIGTPVDISLAGAGVTIDVGDMGTRDILVEFSGSPDIYQAGSQRTSLAVAPTPTETQVTWNGHDSTWYVDVWNRGQFNGDFTDLAPSGHASMWVDGVRVARAPLVSQAPVPLASLTFDHTLLPGLHEVTVRFEPDAGFAASHYTSFHDLERLNPSLRIEDLGAVPWGDIEVGGRAITPDPDDPAPTGQITYEIAGASCTAAAAGGSCTVQVDRPGTYQVSASWPGDTNYVPVSTSRTIEVTRRQSTGTIDVTGPLLATGEPLAVDWAVDGPTAGQVTVQTQRRVGGPRSFGWADTCTGAVTGACTISLPYLACELCEDWVQITFAGDDLYEPLELAQHLDLVTCFPVNLVAEPASGARLRAHQARNCNNGSGYLDGTLLTLTATAPPGVPQQWDMYWDDDFYGYYDGFERTLRPREFLVSWDSRDWTPGIDGLTTTVRYEVGLCAPVVIEAFSYKGLTGKVEPSLGLEPNCPVNARTAHLPQGWESQTDYLVNGERTPFPRVEDIDSPRQPSIAMETAWFALGTQLPVPTFNTRFLATGDDHRYGYSVNGEHVDAITRSDRLVTLEGVTIGATFGPPCTLLDFDAGPGASWSVDTEPFCDDPWAGVIDGWLAGESVTLRVEPPGTQYMANPVGFASQVRCLGCLDGFDQLHYVRDLRVGAEGTLGSTSSTPVVQPQYEQCRELVIDPRGESDVELTLFDHQSVNGVYQLNCPNRSAMDGWHAHGHELELKVEGEPGFRFGQWNHPEFDDEPLPWWSQFRPESPTIHVVMNQDTTLAPSFFRPGIDCDRIHMTANPRAGAGMAGTALTWVRLQAEGKGGDICPAGNVLDGPSDELIGWLPPGQIRVTADVAGGTPRSGWSFGGRGVPTPPAGERAPLDVLGTTVTATNEGGVPGVEMPTLGARGDFHVCTQIFPVFVVELADGSKSLGVDQEGDFLELSEPNCAFDDTAWQVGSRVNLRNVAPPASYEKVALDGFQGVQAFDFTVDGAAETGFKFADYRLVCHTLTLGGESGEIHELSGQFADMATAAGQPTWWSHVETTPLGNCPTTDPRERSYVAGTAVYLEGHEPDDHVRLGWEGSDVELLDDGDTMANAPIVRVTMNRDRFAEFTYREMSDSEQLEDFFESAARSVTEAVGNLVKKATGALAFGMTQYVMGLPPISYMTQPGDMFEAMGGLFSASAWVSTSVLDLLGIPHDPIGPPFCPDGVEIGSDECSWFPQEIDLTLAALDELVNMAVSGSRCTAVWGLSGNGSYAGEAVSMMEEIVDLADSVKGGFTDARDAAAQVQQLRQRQEQYLAAVTAARAAYEAHGTVTGTQESLDAGNEESITTNFVEVMGEIQLDDYDSLADPSALVRCLEEQVEATTEALDRLGI